MCVVMSGLGLRVWLLMGLSFLCLCLFGERGNGLSEDLGERGLERKMQL